MHCSFPLLRSHQRISPSPKHIYRFGNELLAPRPNPKLENYPLSAVRDCLFNTFAATFHTDGRSSVRKLTTRHTVVTRTHLSQSDFKSVSQVLLTFCKALRPTLSFMQRKFVAALLPRLAPRLRICGFICLLFHILLWRGVYLITSF